MHRRRGAAPYTAAVPALAGRSEDPLASARNMEKARVFISHSSADREFVETELVPTLRGAGINTWYAIDDLPRAARRFEREIRDALRACNWFLVVISPAAAESEWVAVEVDWAVEHRAGHIVPVLLDGCAPEALHLVLRTIQAVDYRGDDPRESRRQLLSVWAGHRAAPVLAVMGTKGGVGKTTLTSSIAQLVAEGGHDVAVIDYDVLDDGATNEAKRYFPGGYFSVRTVYDHVAARVQGRAEPVNRPERLAEITPEYIQERHLGGVWLVPARDKQRNRQPFELLAAVPEPRAEAFRELTREIIDRVRRERPEVRLILIDCGAGRNTLTASAFAQADVGYLVTLPNKAYFANATDFYDDLRALYPAAELERVFTIVNRVTSAQEILLCGGLHPPPVAYIPFDPAVERDKNILGGADYGLGYNDVFTAVRGALDKTLTEWEELVPDEIEVRYKPWLRMLAEGGRAQAVLTSAGFRARTVGAWTAVVTGLAVMGWMAAMAITRDASYASLGWLAAALFLGMGMNWLLLVQEPRRRLLRRFAALPARFGPEHRALLEGLLRDSGHPEYPPARRGADPLRGTRANVARSLIRWARRLVDEETSAEKLQKRLMAATDR